MAEKLGVEELKAVVLLGLHLGELVDSLSNGIGLDDIGPALRIVKDAKPALDAVKSGKILPEVKDLDAEEKEALKVWISEELDIADDALEAVIEKALSVIIDLTDLAKLSA